MRMSGYGAKLTVTAGALAQPLVAMNGLKRLRYKMDFGDPSFEESQARFPV
jgi:hypothetical protein